MERNNKSTAIPGLDGKPITALAQQPDGTLWIGSLGDGLIRLKNRQLSFLTNQSKNFLGGNLVRCLLLDPDGTVWMGTDGGGLLRYRDGSFDSFTTRQGLIDNTVLQMVSDNNGNLWLGCKRGICRISKNAIKNVATGRSSSLRLLALGAADGMASEECVGGSGAALKTSDGKLCFSSKDGIVVVDPQAQLTRNKLSAVILEDILMDGRPLTIPPLYPASGMPTVKTMAGTHNFDFQFTGLNFGDPEHIQFKYRLENWDQGWVEDRKERVAHYDKIPPGTYQFRVVGSYNYGPPNEMAASVILIVPPKWWQTFWFHASTTLLGLGLLVVGVWQIQRRRYRVRLKRLEQEQAMERERSRIARDLHDELGSDLTYISMLSDLDRPGANATDRKELLEGMAQKVSALSVQMVRKLDEIVWAVNPRNDSLRSLVLYLSQWSRSVFENSSVRCRYQIQDDLPNVQLPPEMRHHIFLAVKETLNNVLKHAQASEVCLRINCIERVIEIEIQDDGVGFNLAAVQSSSDRNGIRNIQQRIEKLGGQALIETAAGRGTAIKFRVSRHADIPPPKE